MNKNKGLKWLLSLVIFFSLSMGYCENVPSKNISIMYDFSAIDDGGFVLYETIRTMSQYDSFPLIGLVPLKIDFVISPKLSIQGGIRFLPICFIYNDAYFVFGSHVYPSIGITVWSNQCYKTGLKLNMNIDLPIHFIEQVSVDIPRLNIYGGFVLNLYDVIDFNLGFRSVVTGYNYYTKQYGFGFTPDITLGIGLLF